MPDYLLPLSDAELERLQAYADENEFTTLDEAAHHLVEAGLLEDLITKETEK